jgi:hypothetical protein
MEYSFFDHPAIIAFFTKTILLTTAELDDLKGKAKNPEPGTGNSSSLYKDITLTDKDTIKILETRWPIHIVVIGIYVYYNKDTDTYIYRGDLHFTNKFSGGRSPAEIIIDIDHTQISTCLDKNLICLNPVTIRIPTPKEGQPKTKVGRVAPPPLSVPKAARPPPCPPGKEIELPLIVRKGGRRKTKRHHKKYRGSRKVHGRRR